MLSPIFFTPSCFAIFPASPPSSSVGRPPVSRTTSKSTHLTPRLQPVPSAFIAASFTANRPAYRSYLFLNCSQYATSSSVYTRRRNLSLCDSITSRIRGTSATSIPMPTIICSPVRPLLSRCRFHDFCCSCCCDYTGLIVATRKSSLKRRRPGQPAPPAPPVPRIAAPWRLRKSRGLQILDLADLLKLPSPVHGFSTRPGGV